MNLVAFQCHGSNIGPMGTIRSGNAGLTGGVPFVAQSVALRGREGGATAELGGEVTTALRASQGGGDKAYVMVAPQISHTLTAPDPNAPPRDGKRQDGSRTDRLPVVAFQPRYYTRDNKPGGQPQETADITNCHKAGDSAPVVAFDWQSGGDVRLNISDRHTSALQASQTPAMVGQFGVRRLTPRECERLQGFPDDWSAHGVDEGGELVELSDSARYRMLGNAVAVPVAGWIGQRIVEAERCD